jgi:hypothetical protein
MCTSAQANCDDRWLLDESHRRSRSSSASPSMAGLERGNIHPGSRPMTFQLCPQDGQLPQPVGELRIFRTHSGVADRSVKAAEHLLGRIIVTFGMAAGQVRITARLRLQQRRVLENELVPRLAVAYPELVGPLLVPTGRGFCAVDLDIEPVFTSRGDLAGGDAAARTRARSLLYSRASRYSLPDRAACWQRSRSHVSAACAWCGRSAGRHRAS